MLVFQSKTLLVLHIPGICISAVSVNGLDTGLLGATC